MAWDLGLAQGTSRGLAREQAWKSADRNRQAAREDVQFEQLVNQINLNQERKYRRERDEVRDNQFDRQQTHVENQANIRNQQVERDFTFRQKQADIRNQQWGDEYALRKAADARAGERHDLDMERIPKLDAMAEEEHRLRVRGLEAEYDHLYGGETWLGKMIPDNLEKHFPDSWVRQKGYREMLREKSQIDIDEWNQGSELRKAQSEAALAMAEWQKKDYTYRNSPEGQAELKRIRQADTNFKAAQTEYYKARAEALRNPQPTGTSRVKPMTRSEAIQFGRSLTIPSIISKDAIWGFGHYMPYNDPTRTSMRSVIMEQGRMVGRQLRSQNPASTSPVELDQIIGGVWEGIIGQRIGSGDNQKSFDQAITHGVAIEDMTKRRADAFDTFRRSVLQGYNGGGGSASVPNRQGIADTIFNAEGNTGEIDTSFWSQSRPSKPGDDSIGRAYDRVQARKIGERVRQNMGVDKSDFMFDMEGYIMSQADTYTTRGSLDWESYSMMSESQKSKLFNLLSPSKQAQFKIEWQSFQQDQNDPLRARF